MDHICVSSLQFMNHVFTQTPLMSRFNIGNPISFDSLDMRSCSGTLNTLVGNKSFIAKEELTIRPMKNSHLVGGFVGSKSQLGTSNRNSCQIWDIVFCKLMSFMNSNIKPASSLENSQYSYAFVQDLATDMLDSMYRDISDSNDMPDSCAITADTHMCNKLTPISVPQQESYNVKHMESCKQSYADVTKAVKHIEIKGNLKHENIFCSKSSFKKVQIIPVREINNASKRKKQNCRRKKSVTMPDCSAVKPQNDSKKEGSRSYNDDQRKASKVRVQNSIKMQKSSTASDVKKESTTNVKCTGNETLIAFTSNSVNEKTSLSFEKKRKPSCMPRKSNKREFQKIFAYPHMKTISADTSWNCREKECVFENKHIKGEDELLTKNPSFSHVQEIGSHKPNRFHSDSSDSDDFVIFAIAETDTAQIESGSEDDNGDCFSDCHTEDIWDTQEKGRGFGNCITEEGWDIQGKDTDEVDDQVTEDLKKINEKWQKMYSCFPGRPKEPKKVQFACNEKLKTVHSIIAWDFAYRAARVGPWQQIALDQERFMHRILKLEQIISPVLTKEHRLYVRQRTMKYLNAVNSQD